MKQPERIISDGNKSPVCKPSKALFDLKKALCEWNRVVDRSFSNTLYITQSSADACVYMKLENGQIVLVGLYVGDLSVTPSCLYLRLYTEQVQFNCFKTKDLDTSEMILGIEIGKERPQKVFSSIRNDM